MIGSQASANVCVLDSDSDSVNGVIELFGADCGGSTGVVTDQGGSGTDEIRDSDLDAICVNTAISVGIDPFVFCAPTTDGDDVEVSAQFVARALKYVPLPPSTIQVQPPNGRTLVNFDTNFFTANQPFDTSVGLLGQVVDLHIVPTRFDWRFGDGASLATSEPGAPYPDLEVTHRYLEKGQVAPSVDTTYRATYRVNGGRWIKVKGSVTIAGAPVDLEVLTATPTLVGYDRD